MTVSIIDFNERLTIMTFIIKTFSFMGLIETISKMTLILMTLRPITLSLKRLKWDTQLK
jgi:hypothetical protein